MADFQDDARELEMIKLFNLVKDESEGISGIDAYLNLDGNKIPFELKTTSKGSVTTVRDFGLDHIKKWKNKHWLIGFHQKKEYIYYHYGSPDMMTDWINEKAEYIRADFELANIAPEKLTIEDLYKICDKKEIYDYKDAKKIHKNQYKKDEYIKLQDIENGYSPNKMLYILKDRAKYLIERGSTLNNPHIGFNYFSGWEEITENHANRLITLVREYFSRNE